MTRACSSLQLSMTCRHHEKILHVPRGAVFRMLKRVCNLVGQVVGRLCMLQLPEHGLLCGACASRCSRNVCRRGSRRSC